MLRSRLFAAFALAALAACVRESKGHKPHGLTDVSPAVVGRIVVRLSLTGKFLPSPTAAEIELGTWPPSSAPVTLRRVATLEGASASGPSLAATAEGYWTQEEDNATATVDFSAAPTGTYDVQVRTTDGTVAHYPRAVVVLPDVSVGAPPEAAACAHGATLPLHLPLVELPVVDGAIPTAHLSWKRPSVTPNDPWERDAAPVVSDCRTVAFERARVELCQAATVPLPIDVPAGEVRIVLQPTVPVGFVGPTSVTAAVQRPFGLAALGGPYTAAGGDLELPLWAETPALPRWPLLRLPAGASATLDGAPVPVRLDDCVDAEVAGLAWCKTAVATVPGGTPRGAHAFTVTTLPGCSGAVAVTLANRPHVTAVSPDGPICTRQPDQRVVIVGQDFVLPKVLLDGQETWSSPGCTPSDPWAPCDSIRLFHTELAPGARHLVVENGTLPRLSSLEEVVLDVVKGPVIVLEPTPGKVWGEAGREVFVPLLDPAGDPVSAALIPPFTPEPIAAAVRPLPGGAGVTVPGGTPRGPYQVRIWDGGRCGPGTTSSFILDVVAEQTVFLEDFEAGRDQVGITWDGIGCCVPPVGTLAPEGNPGMALTHGGDGPGPTWWFVRDLFPAHRGDVWRLRFDLRRTSAGPASGEPDVIVRIHGAWDLERTLEPPPSEAWTHYEVALDEPTGWTFHSPTELRAATPADLRAAFSSSSAVLVRGRGGQGVHAAGLDNLALDLHP